MTKEETAKLLIQVAAAFPQFRFTKETVEMWSDSLAEFKFDQIKIALKNFILTSGSEFAPSIAQIVAELSKLKTINQETALEAFNALQQGFKMRPDQRPQLGTKRAQRALQIVGGWKRFAEVTDDELPFFKNDFVSAYDSLTERENYLELSAAEAKQFLASLPTASLPPNETGQTKLAAVPDLRKVKG